MLIFEVDLSNEHAITVQVPQRLYSLDELKLNGIEATSLLSPVDTTLGSIERNLQIAAILGGVAAWNAFGLSPQQVLYTSLGMLFLWTLDLVSYSSLSNVPNCGFYLGSYSS